MIALTICDSSKLFYFWVFIPAENDIRKSFIFLKRYRAKNLRDGKQMIIISAN